MNATGKTIAIFIRGERNYIPWLLSVIIDGVLIAIVTIYYGTDFVRKKP